jgi:hypothetical protein
MKRLIFGSLSVLLISTAIAPALKAEMPIDNSTQMDRMNNGASDSQMDRMNNGASNTRPITPANLVSAGYRGEFSDQGIPSYTTFLTDYRAGKFSAKELIQSAINANKLSPQAMSDQQYLNDVESELRAFYDHQKD